MKILKISICKNIRGYGNFYSIFLFPFLPICYKQGFFNLLRRSLLKDTLRFNFYLYI